MIVWKGMMAPWVVRIVKPKEETAWTFYKGYWIDQSAYCLKDADMTLIEKDALTGLAFALKKEGAAYQLLKKLNQDDQSANAWTILLRLRNVPIAWPKWEQTYVSIKIRFVLKDEGAVVCKSGQVQFWTNIGMFVNAEE